MCPQRVRVAQGAFKLDACLVIDGFDDSWEGATGLTGQSAIPTDVAEAIAAHLGRFHAVGWGKQDSAEFGLPAGNTLMG